MTHSFPTRRSSDLDQPAETDEDEEQPDHRPDESKCEQRLARGAHRERDDRGQRRRDSDDRAPVDARRADYRRSEEHTSELQSLMRISYAVFCLKKKTIRHTTHYPSSTQPYE